MKKFAFLALVPVAAVTFGISSPAHAVTIIELDGVANAGMSQTGALALALGAGIYKFNFITTQAYSAFSRWSSSAGCDGAGANCTQGFENSVSIFNDSDNSTIYFGNASPNGGLGPINVPGSSDAYFVDAGTSFAAIAGDTLTLTLTSAANLSFYIFDDNLTDNRGGVALSIAAVPEPATWALMLGGFAMAGAAMRRRTTKVQFA